MEEAIITPIDLGKSISEWGFMALATAFYLTYSALLFGFFMRWLVRIINNIINEQKQALSNIQEMQKQTIDLQEQQLKWQKDILLRYLQGKWFEIRA